MVSMPPSQKRSNTGTGSSVFWNTPPRRVRTWKVFWGLKDQKPCQSATALTKLSVPPRPPPPYSAQRRVMVPLVGRSLASVVSRRMRPERALVQFTPL